MGEGRYAPVATRTHQTAATGVQSNVVLDAGVSYLVVASGSARIANDATGFTDAEYIRYNKNTGPQDGSSPGFAWNNHGVRLDGVVGGTTTGNFWGSYQSDHVYSKVVEGQGTALRGWYSDIPGYYGDNSGSLTVDIYAEVQIQSLSGRVFLDADGDDQSGNGEAGVSGQLVQLLSNDTVIQQTVTSSDGNYFFEDVLVSVFTVRIIPNSDYVATNVTIDGLYPKLVDSIDVSGSGIDFALRFRSAPSPDQVDPFFAEGMAPAGGGAQPQPQPQVQHGIDWSTLTKVTDDVKPWMGSDITGSNWTAKTFSGKVINLWSGNPGQPTTYFCHGHSFGGRGQTVTIGGQQVTRDFSPYGQDVPTLLSEEYKQVVRPPVGGRPLVAASGDIVVWKDADGNVLHTCVIITPENVVPGLDMAHTTVSTKNGQQAQANTTLSKVDQAYSKSGVMRNGAMVELPTKMEFWRLK